MNMIYKVTGYRSIYKNQLCVGWEAVHTHISANRKLPFIVVSQNIRYSAINLMKDCRPQMLKEDLNKVIHSWKTQHNTNVCSLQIVQMPIKITESFIVEIGKSKIYVDMQQRPKYSYFNLED